MNVPVVDRSGRYMTDKRQVEVEEGVSLQCSVGEREDYRESVGTNLGTFAGTKGSNNGRL